MWHSVTRICSISSIYERAYMCNFEHICVSLNIYVSRKIPHRFFPEANPKGLHMTSPGPCETHIFLDMCVVCVQARKKDERQLTDVRLVRTVTGPVEVDTWNHGVVCSGHLGYLESDFCPRPAMTCGRAWEISVFFLIFFLHIYARYSKYMCLYIAHICDILRIYVSKYTYTFTQTAHICYLLHIYVQQK